MIEITNEFITKLYVEEHEQITYADILTDGETVETDYIDTEHRRTLRRECQELIAKLTPQEQIVIKGLYGIDGRKKSTQRLAKDMGVSQKWIQELQRRAFRRWH